MKWFGTYWGAPVCYAEEKVETPVGVRCAYCKQEVEEGDAGYVLPYMGPDPAFAFESYDDWEKLYKRTTRARETQVVYHRRCLHAAIFGQELADSMEAELGGE